MFVKKSISIILMTVMVLATALSYVSPVAASTKAEESRAIAIVFDNSGSMYDKGDKAWCRATYAMEVFASMLNAGDTLMIYPMHPITVGGKQYTMNKPLSITDAAQASVLREIHTKDAAGTPIESIDCAVQGLKKVSADKKCMIVLTDGGTFSKNGHGLSKERTRRELDKRVQAHAGKKMTVMYLGIGSSACMPDEAESEYFSKKQAHNSEDVLSTLTVMCNQIFGRDTLPKKYISGNSIEFDIAMNKLIVFVQGENISDLQLASASGKDEIKFISSQQTKYSTAGAGDYKSVPDKSLQGMMVTYADCPAGNYEISYSGTASSVEVYYEPAADLDFIFTDAEGNEVDLDKLYEGEYKISFGMKDATTGELIDSELLGNPHYEGSYFVNGEETTFAADGYTGEVPVNLKMGDNFKANLTANYLSGYTITKDASDFGWPEEGVKVGAPPLGKFKVSLDVQQDYILLKEMDSSEEIIVNLTIKDEPLTPEEFAAVTVQADCGGIEHTITPNEADSTYRIQLKQTAGLKEGNYLIKVDAQYADIADRTAKSDDVEKVKLGNIPLWVKWAFRIGLLLLLLILAYIISHLKRIPKYTHVAKRDCYFSFDDEDVTQTTQFQAQMDKGSMNLTSKYAGQKLGIMMLSKPGKESYLKTAQKSRYAEVNPASVKKIGSGTIQEVTIGSVRYELNEDTNKLERTPPSDKPFELRHGMRISYSGTVNSAGGQVPVSCVTKLNFKKK